MVIEKLLPLTKLLYYYINLLVYHLKKIKKISFANQRRQLSHAFYCSHS